MSRLCSARLACTACPGQAAWRSEGPSTPKHAVCGSLGSAGGLAGQQGGTGSQQRQAAGHPLARGGRQRRRVRTGEHANGVGFCGALSGLIYETKTLESLAELNAPSTPSPPPPPFYPTEASSRKIDPAKDIGLFSKQGFYIALFDVDLPAEPAWKRWCRLTYAAAVVKVTAVVHRAAMALAPLFPFMAFLANLLLSAHEWAVKQARVLRGTGRGRCMTAQPDAREHSLLLMPSHSHVQDKIRFFRQLYGITDETVAAFRRLQEEVKASSSGTQQKFIADARPGQDARGDVEVTIRVLEFGTLVGEEKVLIMPDGTEVR